MQQKLVWAFGPSCSPASPMSASLALNLLLLFLWERLEDKVRSPLRICLWVGAVWVVQPGRWMAAEKGPLALTLRSVHSSFFGCVCVCIAICVYMGLDKLDSSTGARSIYGGDAGRLGSLLLWRERLSWSLLWTPGLGGWEHVGTDMHSCQEGPPLRRGWRYRNQAEGQGG